MNGPFSWHALWTFLATFVAFIALFAVKSFLRELTGLQGGVRMIAALLHFYP